MKTGNKVGTALIKGRLKLFDKLVTENNELKEKYRIEKLTTDRLVRYKKRLEKKLFNNSCKRGGEEIMNFEYVIHILEERINDIKLMAKYKESMPGAMGFYAPRINQIKQAIKTLKGSGGK